MAKILVLLGSVRQNGNTAKLVQAFAKGAGEKHDVQILSVADLSIAPCRGCEACVHTAGNICVQKDDMAKVYQALRTSDILVIASPMYFYGITAQLKAVIDRLHTPMRNTFAIRATALLLTAGADRDDLFDAVLLQYRQITDFFGLTRLGEVLVRNVRSIGAIDRHPSLEEAYAFGASLA